MSQPSAADWHAQFVRQARWTQATRNHLYRRATLLQAERVLDVGCGTGAVTGELARRSRGQVIGLDIDPEMIAFARKHDDRAQYETGDALALPYPDGDFDIVACHFTLMWISDAVQALREMARVLRRNGTVLICAEPDYGGRLDWPALPIRQWQIDGLRRQGADPCIGRRLRQLMAVARLHNDIGVISSLWDLETLEANLEFEWMWLEHDAGSAVDPATFAQAKARAREALEAGTRLVHVPIFYGIGRR